MKYPTRFRKEAGAPIPFAIMKGISSRWALYSKKATHTKRKITSIGRERSPTLFERKIFHVWSQKLNPRASAAKFVTGTSSSSYVIGTPEKKKCTHLLLLLRQNHARTTITWGQHSVVYSLQVSR